MKAVKSVKALWRRVYQYPGVTRANIGYYFPDEEGMPRLTMAQY